MNKEGDDVGYDEKEIDEVNNGENLGFIDESCFSILVGIVNGGKD